MTKLKQLAPLMFAAIDSELLLNQKSRVEAHGNKKE